MRAIITLLAFCFIRPICYGQGEIGKLEISHLTGDFFIYTTFKNLNGKPFPSNSMYLVTDKGVVLFDTPWDSTQFEPLLDSISIKHHKKVILCIATHFHSDRTAGLAFLKNHAVKTYSSKLTYELCSKYKEKQAEYYFTKDTLFSVGSHRFLAYFPGEGHTKDNIVIWFDQEKILYGGCLVKSSEADGLGYVADANVNAWAATIRRLMSKFANPNFIIPGHQNWQSKNSLVHTLDLINQYQLQSH
jgi:metallo-beta-lactamase class B